MRNKTGLALAVFGLAGAAMVAVPVWAGSGNDKMMHMTIHMTMQMPGMSMPPKTLEQNVCMPAGKFDPEAVQRATSKNTHNQCKVEHIAKHGNEVSYDVMCAAPAVVKIHSVVQLAGDDAFSGKSHATIDAGGHAMTMDSDFTAKRIGSCTYTPPAAS